MYYMDSLAVVSREPVQLVVALTMPMSWVILLQTFLKRVFQGRAKHYGDKLLIILSNI